FLSHQGFCLVTPLLRGYDIAQLMVTRHHFESSIDSRLLLNSSGFACHWLQKSDHLAPSLLRVFLLTEIAQPCRLSAETAGQRQTIISGARLFEGLACTTNRL